jgi:hypothetical protein
MLRFNSIEAQQQVVAELDSALNSWLDNIPAQCVLLLLPLMTSA